MELLTVGWDCHYCQTFIWDDVLILISHVSIYHRRDCFLIVALYIHHFKIYKSGRIWNCDELQFILQLQFNIMNVVFGTFMCVIGKLPWYNRRFCSAKLWSNLVVGAINGLPIAKHYTCAGHSAICMQVCRVSQQSKTQVSASDWGYVGKNQWPSSISTTNYFSS